MMVNRLYFVLCLNSSCSQAPVIICVRVCAHTRHAFSETSDALYTKHVTNEVHGVKERTWRPRRKHCIENHDLLRTGFIPAHQVWYSVLW